VPNTLLSIPHHLQHSDGDCLAACAAMILEHLGISINYGRLLRLLGVKPYGTPGFHLKYIDKLGVNVRYVLGTLQELFQYLTDGKPCIVLVNTGHLPYWSYTTNHAIVIVGFNDREVFVNDPAFKQAPQRIPRDDFELAWMEFDYRYAVIWS
jgi:ABC-type bacteriocin/lantibiotic exporter with double-glycine peptidase domain